MTEKEKVINNLFDLHFKEIILDIANFCMECSYETHRKVVSKRQEIAFDTIKNKIKKFNYLKRNWVSKFSEEYDLEEFDELI